MIDLKKAVHLVSSISAKGNLEEYFKTKYPNDKIQIHCSHNTLVTGPLSDLTSSADFEEYISYWRNIEKICMYHDVSVEDYKFPTLAEDFRTDFSKDYPLIIWHGNETDEKLMLYRYCHLLKDTDLCEINLENREMNPENERYNCLAAINPKHLDGVLNIIKKIDENNKTTYAEEWERLKNDKKTNRILRDRKIISVEENYYDQDLLDNCTSEFREAARVIGETMGQQESTVGDYYLLYRIHVLIQNKLLEYKGNLNEMLGFSVRKIS